MPKRKRCEEPNNRQIEIFIESDRMLSEIDRRGLRSLNTLNEVAAPLPEDAPTGHLLPEAEGTFLVDKYIDAIPFRKDVDRARKLTYVRYAVCIARSRANTKIGQYRGLIEAKLQLKQIADNFINKNKSILTDKVQQSYLATSITSNLADIDRCEALIPELRKNILHRHRSMHGIICEQTITDQIKVLENGLAKRSTLIILGKQLIFKSELSAGTKLDLQKRVFVSEIVGWWFRNTGKWPAKNYNAKASLAANDSALNFYDFLEAARQDAGLTKISPSNTGASGPFERMVRDVISELKSGIDRRAPARRPAQGN